MLDKHKLLHGIFKPTYLSPSSSEWSVRLRPCLIFLDVDLRAVEDPLLSYTGDEDFSLGGEVGLSSLEESPPANARSSASRSAILKYDECLQWIVW